MLHSFHDIPYALLIMNNGHKQRLALAATGEIDEHTHTLSAHHRDSGRKDETRHRRKMSPQ